MICIDIHRNKSDEIIGFSCTGHAGYAEHGSDVVCASVSMLVINTINAIESFSETAFDCSQADGRIECSFKERLDPAAELLMKTMILGIVTCQNEYTDQYVKINC